MNDLFSTARPHPCERLARWTGQTNYWLAFGGSDVAADTTGDALAMGIAQGVCAFPVEVLIAFWGDPKAYRVPLAAAVLRMMEMCGCKIAPRDRICAKRAVLYAVDRFSGSEVWSVLAAAKRANMRAQDFSALVRLADGILDVWRADAQKAWISARVGDGNEILRAKAIMEDEGDRIAAMQPIPGGGATPATALEQPDDLGSEAKPRARLATRRQPQTLHVVSPERRRLHIKHG